MSVTIGEGVTTIRDYAFYFCESLTDIIIPDGVTTLGAEAFAYCYDLNSAVIGDGVTSISNHTFFYCKKLTSVTIGDGVMSIGGYAFYDCVNLSDVTLGDAVTSIDSYAFAWCESMAEINIPNGVTYLGSYVFIYCSSLKSITIPKGVTSLYEGVLYGTTSLTDIYSLSNVPPTCRLRDSIFCSSTFTVATLHVPAVAVDYYSDEPVWGSFSTIVGDAETAGISAVSDERNIVATTDGGVISVSGLKEGERVSVYTIEGRMVGSQNAEGGVASFVAPKGVAIIRCGDEVLKIAVR